jgi:hypothetical protein
MEAEKIGIPSVTVTATSFLPLFHNLAESEGMPGLRAAEYPGTLGVESVATMKEHFKQKTFDLIVEALTKPLEKVEAEARAQKPRDIVFTGTLEEVNHLFHMNRWTDGLAIIPPTIERVEEFLKYCDAPPNEEISILPAARLRATPWNIAVNGVMAGCRPEHMPILIAGVEAMGDPTFNLEQIGTTGGVNLFFVVNGPIVKQLGLEYGQGLISRGANPVIGRALGLVRNNIAGFRPGEQYAGTFGYILPYVLAEDEDKIHEMGWDPYHVEHGYERNMSTVTAGGSNSWGNQTFPSGTDAEGLLKILARNIIEHHALGVLPKWGLMGMQSVIMTPNVAKIIARAYSKQDVKRYLQEHAKITVGEHELGIRYGDASGGGMTIAQQVERGELPKEWLKLGPLDDAGPLLSSPDLIHIFVCGDRTRNKGQAGYSWYNTAQTKAIRLPGNWDKRMAELGKR